MKVRINNRKTFNYIIILILGIILGIPLLSKSLNIYNNDGFLCIAKGYEFSKNFSINEGKILTSFFNYIGTANTLLQAPLATILLFIGNYVLGSYIITYKIIVFGSILLSGIYMHKFTDSVTQNKNIALLSSLLYMSTPIHLGQIYYMNSLNSILIFIFIPMTFYGLYKFFNTTEYSHHVAFGIIGLILTDLKFTAVIGIAIIIYFVINFKNWQLEHVRKYFVIYIIAIVSITAFFVFPYIQTNMFTELVGSNSTKEEFLNSRFSIKNLFVTEENFKIISELGIHIIIMLSFSILSYHKQKEGNKKEFVFYFIMMILYIAMSLKIFPWEIFPKWISKLDDTSGFLIVAAFFECIICSINMGTVLKEFKLIDVLIISGISFLFVFSLKGYIPYTNEIFEINEYNMSEFVDNSILPKKAKKNIKYFENRSKDVEVLKGSGEIFDKNKFLTFYSFKANTYEKDTVYELPFLYYPGYEVRYDGINMDYFESENGMIAIKMNPEEQTYFEVNYVGTDLMNFCKILSFFGLLSFSIYVYKKH